MKLMRNQQAVLACRAYCHGTFIIICHWETLITYLSGVEHKGTQTSTQRIKRIKHKKQNKIKKAAGDSGKNTNQKNQQPKSRTNNQTREQRQASDTQQRHKETKHRDWMTMQDTRCCKYSGTSLPLPHFLPPFPLHWLVLSSLYSRLIYLFEFTCSRPI